MLDRESTEIITMRHMAWERAKGELNSLLHTYYSRYDSQGKKVENGFDEANDRIRVFIEDFEGSSL